jgi:hypothetical protein
VDFEHRVVDEVVAVGLAELEGFLDLRVELKDAKEDLPAEEVGTALDAELMPRRLEQGDLLRLQQRLVLALWSAASSCILRFPRARNPVSFEKLQPILLKRYKKHIDNLIQWASTASPIRF